MGFILPDAADRAIFETPSEQIAAGVVLMLQQVDSQKARKSTSNALRRAVVVAKE
jgi:hypothetical protein